VQEGADRKETVRGNEESGRGDKEETETETKPERRECRPGVEGPRSRDYEAFMRLRITEGRVSLEYFGFPTANCNSK
jgi:hypothetical protein